MSRLQRLTAFRVVLTVTGFLSLSVTGAVAATPPASKLHVDGSYHSATQGIANYDGFDRFRDAKGQPLPGWEYELSSPG